MAKCLSGKLDYRLYHYPMNPFQCQNELSLQSHTLQPKVAMPRTLVLRMDEYDHRSYGYLKVPQLRTNHGR